MYDKVSSAGPSLKVGDRLYGFLVVGTGTDHALVETYAVLAHDEELSAVAGLTESRHVPDEASDAHRQLHLAVLQGYADRAESAASGGQPASCPVHEAPCKVDHQQ